MSSEPESKPLYEKNIYMALLAQQCSRYKEMFKYFEDLIKQREKEGKPKDLLPKERELLSYGYITYINSKRNSLHVCMAFETKEKKEYNSAILGPIRDYRKKIEQELSDTINNISLFLDSVLIKNAEDNNSRSFGNKSFDLPSFSLCFIKSYSSFVLLYIISSIFIIIFILLSFIIISILLLSFIYLSSNI